MEGRERLRRAIEFKNPDRIPINLDDVFPLLMVPPQSFQPKKPYYPYIHPAFVKLGFWKSEEPLTPDWENLTREAIDEWGTIWRVSKVGSQGEVIKGALEDSWELLDDFTPPDFRDWSRFSIFAELSKRLGKDKYRLAVNENSIWERFRFLRGFNNAMVDLIENPDKVEALLEILTEATLDVVNNFHKAGADGFMLLDDWGTQTSTFISPEHFDRFFKPCYQRVVELCHKLGMHCGIHSCGRICKIIPSLIEIKMDFLQLDSPNMCGLEWLSQNARGRIALFCSPDIQEVYCKNDPELLVRHIKMQILKLADQNGGFAAWLYAEPEAIGVKLETVSLARELYFKYGSYPLDLKSLEL